MELSIEEEPSIMTDPSVKTEATIEAEPSKKGESVLTHNFKRESWATLT